MFFNGGQLAFRQFFFYFKNTSIQGQKELFFLLSNCHKQLLSI
jgi:hypothetical protein